MNTPQGPTFLIFDTETTGLPKKWGRPMEDVDNFPRITQIGFIVVNLDGFIIDEFQSLIKPDGWVVPKEKFFIENNMSTERCEKEGFPIDMVLRRFQDALKGVDYKVAHNMAFDKSIVGAEMIRLGMTHELFKYKPEICTMKSTTKHVAIKSHAGGNKWPKLMELHQALFGEEFDGAHDAMSDVKACGKCLLEAIGKGWIKLKK